MLDVSRPQMDTQTDGAILAQSPLARGSLAGRATSALSLFDPCPGGGGRTLGGGVLGWVGPGTVRPHGFANYVYKVAVLWSLWNQAFANNF